MICPILSQSRTDDDGTVTWDHHECIEEACSFWAGEISDCGIRASGLLVIARAKAVARRRPVRESDASELESADLQGGPVLERHQIQLRN